MPDLGNYI